MYKKYMTILLLCNSILVGGFFCIHAIQAERILATPAFHLYLAEELAQEEKTSFQGALKRTASRQRIVDYGILQKGRDYELDDKDYEALLRIVEAEAGSEDVTGKLLVANVVLNRVNHPDFPDTVREVVFQSTNGTTQFAPVGNGRYDAVMVSDETIDAVGRAIEGEDVSEGALYFVARKYARPEKMEWFDNHLTFLFCHGGHEFFS